MPQRYNQGRAFPIENAGAPVAGTNAVHTLTIGGTPTGGTFTLKGPWGGYTNAITWSATNATLLANIQAALDAMFGAGNTVASAGTLTAGIGTVLITFQAALGVMVVPAMAAGANNLTGTNPTIAVAVTTPGVAATGRGAPKGAALVNTSTGDRYINAGTTTAPNWVREQSAGTQTMVIAKVALAAVDTGGGVFSWLNPEAGAIIVKRVILDVTTPSSGACSVSVGSTAVSGTTSSANLLDTQSVAAAGQLDNVDNHGTNGKAKQKVAAGAWVTASVASGASAGLVGSAYIEYILA